MSLRIWQYNELTFAFDNVRTFFSINKDERGYIKNQIHNEGHIHGFLLGGLHLLKVNNNSTICLVSHIFIAPVNVGDYHAH